MILLPITLTIAGAAALLHIWLSVRVSQLRVRHKVLIGDQDNLAVRTRMRAHGNFAENMPIMLILLGVIELASGSSLWLWGAAILFILARIAHAFGMDRPGANPLRVGGIAVCWAVLLGMGGYAIMLAYQSPSIRGGGDGIQISPGRSAASQDGSQVAG